MAQTPIDELIAQLQQNDAPLTPVALALESTARSSGNAAAAALIAQELQGYSPGTDSTILAAVGRSGEVLGLMKLSALENRLALARKNASAAPTDAAGELARIKAGGEVQQLEQILAGRRQFLLGIAHRLQSAPASQRWVCSIHGIMTRGAWQKQLAPLLAERGFHPYLFDYKWYDPIRMLSASSRDKKIDAFRDEYGIFMQIHKDVLPSIIAHSMGSYIVTRAIEKYDLKFDRVILCGSIVREGYPWDSMIALGRVQRVLHDYGRKDIWARLAAYFIEDAGQSGYNGFEQTAGDAVVQRRHVWFKHSDYFYATNFIERWIPFLAGNDPPQTPPDDRSRINWKFRIVKWTVIGVILAAVVIAVLRF